MATKRELEEHIADLEEKMEGAKSLLDGALGVQEEDEDEEDEDDD